MSQRVVIAIAVSLQEVAAAEHALIQWQQMSLNHDDREAIQIIQLVITAFQTQGGRQSKEAK